MTGASEEEPDGRRHARLTTPGADGRLSARVSVPANEESVIVLDGLRIIAALHGLDSL